MLDIGGGQEWQQSNGYIDRLEVNNFKSYRGRQEIGPFKSFTAVVGPNGSGKSNLMDAISFVLGVRTTQLRGSLKELLYRNSEGSTEEDQPRRGHVKLIYCTDEGEQVAFARHIQPSSADDPNTTFQSVYKVNDRTVSWEAYSQKLSSFGILVKVRNFLVFQGDIEAVAAKSPQGLTVLFEQISGSEAYRQQYEELQKATLKADEKVSIAFSRKKAVAAERKQKKEQKDEAEKYLAKQQELRDLHVEQLLFTLYHLRNDRDHAVKEAAQLQQQAAKVAKDHSTFEEQLEAIKRRQASHAKEKLLHEKKIKKQQTDRDKKTPDLHRAKEAAQRLGKSITTQEKEIAELVAKVEAGAAKIKQLEKELKSIEKARAKVESEAKAHLAKYTSGAGAGLNDAAIHAEYQQIKASVAEKTAKLQSERDTFAAQLKADQDALQQLLDQEAAYKARADSLRQQAQEYATRAAAAAEESSTAKKQLKAKKEEKVKCDDALRQNSSQREYLELELSKVQAKIREAGSERKEAKREAMMTQAVEKLKQLYPHGVYGRLTDLGKVSRRDYHLALSVAMGRNIDSVIVDTERTARDAIQYLKESQIPPMTFVPLQSCKVHPVNERLRSGLGGTARLALDLVEPERPEFARAFQYAFDNTLVCDGVEEARQLAFGGAERHKVVAKDGTQFNRAGLITGGDAGNLTNKAGRWDDKLMSQLKTQQEKFMKQLQDLPSITSLREKAAGLSQEVQELEARISYKDAEAKAAKEHYKQASKEAGEAETGAAGLRGQIDTKQAAVEQHDGQVQAVLERIHQVADRLFAPLSARLGVANIREYEETHAQVEADLAKERTALDTKEAKVKQQLEFERGRNMQKVIDTRQEQLDKDRTKHEQLEARVGELQAEIDELVRAMDSLREACRKADIEVEKAQADQKDLRKRGGGLTQELTRLARAQAGAENTAKSAEGTARNMVTAAEVEGVQLPRLAGAAALQEVADAMEVDESTSGQGPASGAGPSSGVSGTQAGTQGGGVSVLDGLDFSSLSARLTREMHAKEQDTMLRSLQQARAELKSELEGMSPNLKAVEQYEVVKEKEKELTAALDEARKEAGEVQTAFNKCRQSRLDTFMAAFQHISHEIDTIYKELTSSSVHPLGGTAYLSLEQPDEPYLAGIKYTAMPPTKRFRDMEQLSGGEKTVAALALLFAIHSYRPSPFFVLDEVDAALDATNVARVAHYIRDKTRGLNSSAGVDQADGSSQETPRFQSIVISLKDIFYEKADALVGVARDVDKGCSTTFTFDLSAFGEPLAADA